MPRIRPEMRLVLAFTLMSLLLGEGAWALTCHCHGEGSACISENNCTGATLCYLRVIYQQDRDSYVDYGCIDDFGGLINPSLICNRTMSHGRDETHFLCCGDYDFCNKDLSIPPRESGPSSSSSPVTPTPTHSPTPEKQENKISLWLLLIVTIIPTIFILNLILCILLGIHLRQYHRIRTREQRQSEVRSTGSDQIQFVNSTTCT